MPYDRTKDPLDNLSGGASGPGRRAASVTPSDASDLSSYARGLYVGGTGDLVVIPVGNADGAPVTFKAHPIGYMPVAVRRVLATGTTATNILAIS
jgi:hypothetical protein